MTLPSLVLVMIVSLSAFIIGSLCVNKLPKDSPHEKSPRKNSDGNGRSCANTVRPNKNNVHVTRRNKRDVFQNGRKKYQFGNAVYFSGSEIIRYIDRDENGPPYTPSESFTVELWVKPEGGQQDPAVIIGTVDKCRRKRSSNGWSVGIASFNNKGVKDTRFYFALLTERSTTPTFIYSNTKYSPNEWVHLAAQYDTIEMRMLINGVQVAVDHAQKGAVFGKAMVTCEEIHVGGNKVERIYYRGAIDELKVWRTSRIQRDVKNSMDDASRSYKPTFDLSFYDSFVNLKQWQRVRHSFPRLVESDLSPIHGVIDLSPPFCGYTECDNPSVIRSYITNPQLRSVKTVKYRVVNLYDDENKTNPIVSKERIMAQHRSLQNAFKQYNITWDLDMFIVENTTMRKKTALFSCSPSQVGNGVCDPECQYSQTGNDGGDCDQVQYPCNLSRRGDSKCDAECNNARFNWDNGDCCQTGPDVHLTCYDPSSINRGYISAEELKSAVGLNGHDALNVYFASWPDYAHELVGVATFPWDDTVYSIQGGTVIQPKNFGGKGKLKGLVHEFGHNLGLWHVHHGVSELDCSNPCWETHASFELGDLCEDTAPTPRNLFCHDPDGSEDVCGVFHHKSTPYRNFMGYADDDCIDHFTPHQVARMHCYLDLVYQPWRNTKRPPPPPLSPKPIKSSNNSVTIAWVSSLGGGPTDVTSLCSQCSNDGTLVQYAFKATSSHAEKQGYMFTASEATGTPNDNVCGKIEKSWIPDTTDCYKEVCFIELEFQYPVKAKTLDIWVNWSGEDGVRDVIIKNKDNSTKSYGMLPTFCDIPLTVTLEGSGIVDKVIIYISTPYVAIDAVKLTSVPNRPKCQQCRRLKYQVYRIPHFEFGEYSATMDTSFTDRNVTFNETYEYFIKAVWGKKTSLTSPVLHHTHGQAYCGDGEIQGKEECDDGNLQSGDGCSIECNFENGFRCKGNPSLCYIYDGDGICEDFEHSFNSVDCGYIVPKGFEDQWAVTAIANPAFQHTKCPANVVVGEPRRTLKCNVGNDMNTAWRPCMRNTKHAPNYWLEVFFSKHVVATEIFVHIASDGQTLSSPEQKNITVDVIDVNNVTKPLKDGVVKLSCNNNPASLPVIQDLSKPFIKIRGVRIRFQSDDISIAAVRLRSSRSVDPLTISTCNVTELYNPRTGQCVKERCDRPKCPTYRIKHGSADCTGSRSGDICSLSCKKGYYLKNGLKEVACNESGRWTSGMAVKCAPIDCGRPSVPHASTACRMGTTFGKTCEFKCNTKIAKLKGTDTTIRCEADGIWSPPQSYCQVFCPAPEHIRHSIIVTKGCRSGLQKVGDVCKVKCKRGYHVNHRPIRRKVMKVECSDDGEWIGENCVPVTCPPIPPVYTGLYKCEKANLAGSKCSLKCPKQTEAYTTQCLFNGHWSRRFEDMNCDFGDDSRCSIPEQKDLQFTCDGNAIGSFCKVKCSAAHHHPVISVGVGSTGLKRIQMADDMIHSVVCSGLLVWYPLLKNIACLPDPCLEDFIGDGFCDAKNNREYCQYDGGDCCDSTAPNGSVKTEYKAKNCQDDCECQDPHAKENITTKTKVEADPKKTKGLHERSLNRRKTSKKKHRMRRNRLLRNRLTKTSKHLRMLKMKNV